jgi:hypothetical protein
VRTLLVAAALLVGGLAVAPAPGTYTLMLNQPSPVRGDTVTFTGTFPREAFRSARTAQFHENPQLSLQCGNELRITQRYATGFTRDGVSFPITLASASYGSGGSNGYTWPEGEGAHCVATSGWWTYAKATGAEFHFAASLTFDVPPS